MQLLAPLRVHLEELVVERCSDFLSVGMHHFTPLATLTRLKVCLPSSAVLPLVQPVRTACVDMWLILWVRQGLSCSHMTSLLGVSWF